MHQVFCTMPQGTGRTGPVATGANAGGATPSAAAGGATPCAAAGGTTTGVPAAGATNPGTGLGTGLGPNLGLVLKGGLQPVRKGDGLGLGFKGRQVRTRTGLRGGLTGLFPSTFCCGSASTTQARATRAKSTCKTDRKLLV